MARRNPMPDLTTINLEMRLLLGALIFGAVAVPLLVWVTGRLALGPYGNGGMFAIVGDFFTQLYAGSTAAWIVLLAPYALLTALRIAAAIFRRL